MLKKTKSHFMKFQPKMGQILSLFLLKLQNVIYFHMQNCKKSWKNLKRLKNRVHQQTRNPPNKKLKAQAKNPNPQHKT